MTTIHLVTHTHWDREWYLTFQQFRLKLVRLVDKLLDILDKDPLYAGFLLDGQAILLEDYLQIRPEREMDLIRHVQAGRLFIGPWYISPDEFLISSESHVRNLIEGDRICRRFGGKMEVGYLPDTFGHIGQIPQILTGFGIDAACVWRGLDDQSCELDWRAPDGSTVLLSYLRESYSNAAGLVTTASEKFIHDVRELASSLEPYSCTGQILLMAGTDHMEPSRDVPAAIAYYQSHTCQVELLHSNLPRYFASVRDQLAACAGKLPVITGELRSPKHSPLLPGVLSARIWIKQRNHACETGLLKWVEPFTAVANLLGPAQTPYNNSLINHPSVSASSSSFIKYAWKLLMQCHPHDSICGTSIDQVAEEMHPRFDQVDQVSHELTDKALKLICNQVNSAACPQLFREVGDNNPVIAMVVFNPNDAPQTGLVDLNINLSVHVSSLDLIDEAGNIIPLDQSGMRARQLISVSFDKKELKQGFHMVDEGRVAGFIIRDFQVDIQGHRAIIQATISDHGEVDVNKWHEATTVIEKLLSNPDLEEFFVQAYSDPEINLSFVACDVPAHGYRTYWLRGVPETNGTISTPVKLNPLVRGLMPLLGTISKFPFFARIISGKISQPARSAHLIENEYFRVEPHPDQNGISVLDKRTNQVFSGLNRFEDTADRGDLYNYCPLDNDIPLQAHIKSVEVTQCTTYQRLVIHSELRLPTRLSEDRKSRQHFMVSDAITSKITLVPGVPRIDVHTEIENHARDHRLRVQFPAPFTTDHAYYDGHFEIVRHAIGIPVYDASWEEMPRTEVPQGQFTSIANAQLSLTIANRGLPEVEVYHNQAGNCELAITLLRCVGWLSRDDLSTRKNHAGPMGVATPQAQMEGRFSFDYSIIPADGRWTTSIPLASAFNAPCKSLITSLHPGSLPANCSFIFNDNPAFIITTIKQPEVGGGMIVRGYNRTPDPIDVRLKTWRPFTRVQLTRLDEQPLEQLQSSQAGEVNFEAAGHKIITLHYED